MHTETDKLSEGTDDWIGFISQRGLSKEGKKKLNHATFIPAVKSKFKACDSCNKLI